MIYIRLSTIIVTLLTLTFSLPSFAQEDAPGEYIVRVVYLVPKDRNVRPGIDASIDRTVKRTQKFFADELERHGYPRKTFEFESDENGNVVVHHFTGKYNDSHYRSGASKSLWEYASIQTRNTILLAYVDVSSGIVSPGVCGEHIVGRKIVIPSFGGCYSWQTTAHELAHAFTLGHDFRSDGGVMGGPGDNLSECAAGWLVHHPYFNGGKISEIENRVQVKIASSITYPRDNLHVFFELIDPDGLHQVMFRHSYLEVHSCQYVSGERAIVHFETYDVQDKSVKDAINIETMDINGNARFPGWFKYAKTEPNMELDISPSTSGVDDGLIGYWTFDEASGKYAFDGSGNSRYAQLSDGVVLDFNGGKIGGALRLDGSKEHANVTNGSEFLNGLRAFSLCLWVKSNQINTDSGFIFGKWPNGKDEIFSMRYDSKGLSGGGKNIIKAAIKTTFDKQSYESSSNVQTTDWQHITLTWKSNDKLRLYINGVLDKPTYNSRATLGSITSVDRLIIGRGSNDKNSGWDGLIDDIRLYNRVLNANEIKNLPYVNPEAPRVHGVALTGATEVTVETVEMINANADLIYTLTVTNTGNTNDTINLTKSGDDDAVLSKTSVPLAAGTSATVTLTVPKEKLAVAGDYVEEITATSQGDRTKTAEITITTILKPLYAISLEGANSLETDVRYASTGIEYPFKLTNTGNTTDTINLTASGDAVGTLSQTSVSLAPGASSDVKLILPGDTVDDLGDYVVKVTATSEGDTTITPELIAVIYVVSGSVGEKNLFDGLISHWAFDEASGKTAVDVEGNNDAILEDGATLAPNAGRVGGAVQFDGSSGGVSVDNGAKIINGLDAFTLSLWIKSNKTNTDRGFIFPKIPNGKDEIFSMRYDSRGLSGGGRNVIKAAIKTTGGKQSYESAGEVQTTDWQHLALTWRSGRGLTLYINGVPDQSTYNSEATEGTVTGVEALLIGRSGLDKTRSWDGLIDEVRLYNRVLKPTEISELASGVEVKRIYGVRLEGVGDLTNQTQDARAGVTYYFTVTNNGETEDTIRLTTSGDATGTFSRKSVPLVAGETSQITMTIPGSALTVPGEYVVKIKATSNNDNTKTAEIATTTTIHAKTNLLPNFPNPCNPETWIPYQLEKASDVTLTIYAVTGEVVRTLALGHQSPGVYQSKSQAAYWDGKNEHGEVAASGVYFYKLEAGDFTATRKMLVLK